MSDAWGNDPAVSGGAHSDWGNDPIIAKASGGAAPPAAGAAPDMARAQSMRPMQMGVAPPQMGDQKALFDKKAQIEARLKAAGKNPADDPEWQQATRALGQSVVGAQRQVAQMSGVSPAGAAEGMARGGAGTARDIAGAVSRGAAKIPSAYNAASQFVKDVMPGAAGRVMDEVSKVGTITDKSKLGSRIMKSLRPNYDAMYAERGKHLESVAPASKYIGAEETEQAKLNAARVKVYNDPKYAELRKFESTPLGRKIIADTTKYSNVPRLDPKDLPSKVFYSAQSVKDMRELLGTSMPHPQDAVESFAAEHAAQSLHEATTGKDISQAANAAKQWATKNRDWLEEVPVTKAAVQHYVDRLKSVASAQKVAAPIAKGALTGAGIGAGVEGYKYLTE